MVLLIGDFSILLVLSITVFEISNRINTDIIFKFSKNTSPQVRGIRASEYFGIHRETEIEVSWSMIRDIHLLYKGGTI